MAISVTSTAVTVVLYCLLLMPSTTHQFQTSQTEVLQQLRRQLEYPKQLDAWSYTEDLCYTPSSPSLTIVCDGISVTELKVIGDRLTKPANFLGYPISNYTLSSVFSADSFFTTLTRLPSLKVVILVSLGIWGELSDKIHRLDSLRVLDLSSNYLYGSIPPKISVMTSLQTLTLDGNFLNGSVPDWFDSLTNITVLSLQKNRLKGPLPESIGRVGSLIDLTLSSNGISGGIPDLSGLSSLEVLDMRDNKFDSDMPTLPRGLVTILLNKNSLKGDIQQLGEMSRLQHVDLSFNLLEGNLPESLFSLPNISYVNLASNKLSGDLPVGMICSGELGFVDLSGNKLTGSLPPCLNSQFNKRVVKVDGNCLAGDSKHQLVAAHCQVNHKNGKGPGSKNVGLVVAPIVGIAIVALLLLFVFLLLFRRCCGRQVAEQRLLPKSGDSSASGFSSELLANARYISQTIKLGTQVLPTYRVFSIDELKEATGNFGRTSLISEGSLGKLYKGSLEGNFVAIRCLTLFKRYSIRNLKLRLDLLSKLRHPHLVCLLGHCIDGVVDNSGVSMVFLVYEFVPNGSFRSRLSSRNPEKVLKWIDRLTVLISVAKAVHFLHTGIIPGFLNNRLRTNNILLDEHCIAKVSDYGLSIITEEIYKYDARARDEGQKHTQSKSAALEMVKLEDDVYSFGLILLEILVEPSISETGGARSRGELVASFNSQDERKHIIDPIVLCTCSQESLSIVISLTHKCLSSESSVRPSIEDVLWNLQYAAQVQATADGEHKSGPIPRP